MIDRKKDPKEQLITNLGFNEHFTAGHWAEYNRKFFNDLAPKYDYLNRIITLGMQDSYKKKAVARSHISNGDLVLDICTGSGDMAFLTASMNPRCHVIGVDVAEKMIEVARQRAQDVPNVEFRLGDALRLPFDDRVFDSAIMSYGLRNLENIRKGIMEMKRVIKKSGSLSVVDLGKPKGLFNRAVYKIYFENLMPFLGKHIFHRGEFNSFKYLPESNKFFPRPEELKILLTECGIGQIKTYHYMMGMIVQHVGIVR